MFFTRDLLDGLTHSKISVLCEHMCVFFISMWKRWCRASQKEARLAQKPVSAFFLLFFFPPLFLSSSLFFPLWFTRPSHTSSKGLPDTPLSEALSPVAPQSPHSVHVCVCVKKRTFEHLRAHTFYPLLPPQRKESVGGKKQKKKRGGRRVGEEDGQIE